MGALVLSPNFQCLVFLKVQPDLPPLDSCTGELPFQLSYYDSEYLRQGHAPTFPHPSQAVRLIRSRGVGGD